LNWFSTLQKRNNKLLLFSVLWQTALQDRCEGREAASNLLVSLVPGLVADNLTLRLL
jgi:hypothetical protein